MVQAGPSSQQETKKVIGTEETSEDSPKTLGQRWNDHTSELDEGPRDQQTGDW